MNKDFCPECEDFKPYLKCPYKCCPNQDGKSVDQDEPVSPEDEISSLLRDRGARYGYFTDHARVCQMLKTNIDDELAVRGKHLPADMKQALDAICDKIARIINGDHNYADNWVDIAGYAQLISNRLQGKEIIK